MSEADKPGPRVGKNWQHEDYTPVNDNHVAKLQFIKNVKEYLHSTYLGEFISDVSSDGCTVTVKYDFANVPDSMLRELDGDPYE